MMAVTWNSLSADQQNAAREIVASANRYGVDARLAVATAWQESKLNAKAVGDSGHSIGLFQLYDRGEGAGMSTAQREDPATNANKALSVFASMKAKYSDPGTLAAKAQRPAEPAKYALSVNNLYADPGFLPNVTATKADLSGSSMTAQTAGLSMPNLSVPDLGFLTKLSTWVRVLETVMGGLLIAVGLGLFVISS